MGQAIPVIGSVLAYAFPQFAPAILVVTAVLSGVVNAEEARRARRLALEAGKRNLTTMVRSSQEPHHVAYGTCRLSGPILFTHGTGGDGGQLYLVVALTGHEVYRFRQIIFNETDIGVTRGAVLPGSGYFGNSLETRSGQFTVPGNFKIDITGQLQGTLAAFLDVVKLLPFSAPPPNSDDPFPLNSIPIPFTADATVVTLSGDVSPGDTVVVGWREWVGQSLVIVKSYTGTATQEADEVLIANSDGRWTAAHQLKGRAYIRAQMQWQRDRFASGAPNISAILDGVVGCYDPRDLSTGWSNNPGLVIREYLTNGQYGLRASAAEIDDDSFIAGANICDEFIEVDTETLTDQTVREKWQEVLRNGVLNGTWEPINGDDNRVRLLLHFDGSGSGAFFDEVGHGVANIGAVTYDNLIYRFAPSGGRFNGSNYLTIGDSADTYLGAEDFTIEAEIYWDGSLGVGPGAPGSAGGIVAKNQGGIPFGEYSLNVHDLGAGGFLEFGATTGGVNSSWNLVHLFSIPGSLNVNGWYHVAVTRQGDLFTLWINGFSVATATALVAGGAVSNTGASNTIGANKDDGSFTFFGVIDEVRLMIGTAVYTSNFQPPLQPFTINLSTAFRQRRYTCNGSFSVDRNPADILSKLLSSCAGQLAYTGGVYRLVVGAYQVPTLTLTADDFRGPLTIVPRKPYRDLFNSVRGLWAGRDTFEQFTDFPPVTNPAYVAQDGGETIDTDLELAFTNDVVMAQRIAKIHLEKERLGLVIEAPCKLKALTLRPGDTVNIDMPELFTAPTYPVPLVMRVVGWTFRCDEDYGIDLVLQQEDAASYDWDINDATLPDLPPTMVDAPAAGPGQPAQVNALILAQPARWANDPGAVARMIYNQRPKVIQ